MRRPPPDPDRHHRSGVAKYERGDLKGALRDYSRALKLAPLRADILNDRGIVRKAMGDALLAMGDYAAALDADPAYWQAYANRGTLLAQRGNYEAALYEFDRGLLVGPKQAQLYCYRANSHGCLMDYRAALADYTTAIKLDPKMGAAWFGRGGTHQVLATLTGVDGEVLVAGKTFRPSPAAARKHLRSALADFKKARTLARPGCGYLEELPQLLRDVEAELGTRRK